MIFKVVSKYFGVLCDEKTKPEHWKYHKEFSEYLNALKPCLIRDNGYYYIKLIYITEINQIIDILKQFDVRYESMPLLRNAETVEVDIKNKKLIINDYICLR
jgi:hypothetical protein